MKERALVPAETEFSFNQNSGRVVRVEIMCCGAGGLGLYRAEEGTLGMKDYICSLFSCSFKVEADDGSWYAGLLTRSISVLTAHSVNICKVYKDLLL